MNLCALVVCSVIQHAEPPRIVLPGVADATWHGAVLDSRDVVGDDAQPNVIPVAIVLFGHFVTLTGTVVTCASSDRCSRTARKFWDKFTDLGRRIVGTDTGSNVETLSFSVSERDADGDGDVDYVIDSWLENGYDRLEEYSDNDPGYYADVADEAEKQNAWLLAHGR